MSKQSYYFVYIFVAFLYLPSLTAQQISDVRFQVEGETIVITFAAKNPEKLSSNVSIYFSVDHGTSYQKCMTVEGDVGENVILKKLNVVSWEVTKDVEHLDGDLSFKIESSAFNAQGNFLLGLGGALRFIKITSGDGDVTWLKDPGGYVNAGYLLGSGIGFYGKTVVIPIPGSALNSDYESLIFFVYSAGAMYSFRKHSVPLILGIGVSKMQQRWQPVAENALTDWGPFDVETNLTLMLNSFNISAGYNNRLLTLGVGITL
jgi:hypothetical protein